MNRGVDTDKGNHKMIKGSEIGFVHEKIGHNLYEKRIFFLLSMFSLKKCEKPIFWDIGSLKLSK